LESGGLFLASNEHRINSGSGQQLVTVSPEKVSTHTLWIVKEGDNLEPCRPGLKIPYGTKIRLTHLTTQSNLHSHHVSSPLTRQQEVTGFGGNGEGDHGDDWVVQPLRGNGQYWERGVEVTIKHAQTGKYLGASSQAKFTAGNCGRQCPVMNHLEAFGRARADKLSSWKAEVGVFLSK